MPAATHRDGSLPDSPQPNRAAHWQEVHAEKGAGEVSWWQEPDSLWLDLVERTGVAAADPVIDVGAGASLLVDALLDRGFADVTVLDVAPAALDRVRERLGARASAVHLVAADVTQWRGDRPYALWHDRAVLHFLTDQDDQDAYVASLLANLAPGGAAILATFAPDGPQTCSGLPVRRYAADELVALVGEGFALEHSERRVHTTPWGGEQPFTVALLRRV
jgi:trans-aconitate methyltransferase